MIGYLLDFTDLFGPGVLGDVAEEQIDSALHDVREYAFPFFVVGLDLENGTGKRLRESDNAL